MKTLDLEETNQNIFACWSTAVDFNRFGKAVLARCNVAITGMFSIKLYYSRKTT